MIYLLRHLLDSDRFDYGLHTSWRRDELPHDIAPRLKVFESVEMIRPRFIDVLMQNSFGKLNNNYADVIINVDPIGTTKGARHIITVVHDLYFKVVPENYTRRERFISDAILRFTLRGSDRVICVSQATQDDLARFYPGSASKACVIYPDAASFSSEAHVGRRGGGPIIWVGNVSPNKNIKVFYEALDLLAERGHLLDAVIVGRDPFGFADDAERKLARARPPLRLGNVDDAELKALYERASCLVNTSLYEGFGMPIVEAQRMRLPVVCPTAGAIGEVAGRGALTFNPHSPSDLAAAIERVVSDEDVRRRLVELGMLNQARFSWSRSAAAVEGLIADLLPDGRAMRTAP